MLMVLLPLPLRISSWWMMVGEEDNTCCFLNQSKSMSTLLGPKAITPHQLFLSLFNFNGNLSRKQISFGDSQEGWSIGSALWEAAADCLWWGQHHGEARAGGPCMSLPCHWPSLLLTWQAWQEAWPCCEAKWADLSLDASPGSPGDQESKVGFDQTNTKHL